MSYNKSKNSHLSADRRIYDVDSISNTIIRKIKNLRGLLTFGKEVFYNPSEYASIFKYKNSQKGKYCLLLGHGPSLNNIIPDKVNEFQERGHHVISMNYYNNIDLSKKIKPDFLCITDPHTFDFNETAPLLKKNIALKKYVVEQNIKIICGLTLRKKFIDSYQYDNVEYVCCSNLRMWTSNISPILPAGYTSMTAYRALAFAVWAGYEKIFILGIDNTYFRNFMVDETNNIYRVDEYYNNNIQSINISNIYPTVKDMLVNISFLFNDLKKFKKRHSSIINLDKHSFVDAFSKGEFNFDE